jgi:HK97 family phage major capsid protein
LITCNCGTCECDVGRGGVDCSQFKDCNGTLYSSPTSPGFKVIDATYDSESEVFTIKEVELVEISVVSVPCNQNTLFSLAKAFDNAEDYSVFKKQFTSTKSEGEENSTTKKEWTMSPEEIKQMLETATKSAAEQATAAYIQKQEELAKEKAAKAEEEQALQKRIDASVATQVSLGESGAERLLAEVTKRIESEQQKALSGLESAIKEKADELAKLHQSKMSFSDKGGESTTYEDREKAVILSKMLGRPVNTTRFGAQLLEKGVNAHVPGAAPWELEVSLNLENEIRRRLVVAPTLRTISMATNVMRIPLNPEATNNANWVPNANFSETTSAGTARVHQLREITLSAFKLATSEYIGFEEEEDSLLVLTPIIRDAMVRRTARALDRAFVFGQGSGTDPVTGIASYDTTSAVTQTFASACTVAKIRALRADMGVWGIDPAQLVYVVSQEVYYDLLEDPAFQTMNQVGPQATLLTGQIGQIGSTPVLVSGEFPAKITGASSATGTANYAAFCFAPANFIAGNQRGLRFDSQDLVETQRRILVASMRMGLVQISNQVAGVTGIHGVSTLRWV